VLEQELVIPTCYQVRREGARSCKGTEGSLLLSVGKGKQGACQSTLFRLEREEVHLVNSVAFSGAERQAGSRI